VKVGKLAMDTIVNLEGYSIQEIKAFLFKARGVRVIVSFVSGREWFPTTKTATREWLDNYVGVTMCDHIEYNQTHRILEIG